MSRSHQFSRPFCTTSCNRVRQNMLRAPLHQGLYHGPRLRTAPQRVPPNVV
ncbi:hypothetical protein JG687_00018408, partial [Phytophthora cactorum]